MSITNENGTDAHEASDFTVHIGAPLDPEKTVVRPGGAAQRPDPAPVPEPDSAAELGAKRGGRNGALSSSASFMPPVYGPRAASVSQAPEPSPDPAGGVAASNARAALPSLARRDRRGRVVTLACYAAALIVTGVGLWVVAALAFAG